MNAHKIEELADSDERNEYPVLFSLPFDSCLMVLIFVVQSDELLQPLKSVQPTPVPTNISVADPFEIFKTHATMQTICSIYCALPVKSWIFTGGGEGRRRLRGGSGGQRRRRWRRQPPPQWQWPCVALVHCGALWRRRVLC